jgi:nicotinate-nucleotide adenylyltransferase
MGQDPDASTEPPLRIGLFGGTFDPPHCGHVAVAADVADALDLDQVFWIPAGQPPHKSLVSAAPLALRLEMTRAAIKADSRFKVSSIEVERGCVSYTLDTVRSLRGSYPGTILFLIIGTDQFRDFGTWQNPEKLLELTELVVMDRDGLPGSNHIPDVEGAEKAHFVSVGQVDISSTDVRSAVRNKQDIRSLVPTGVAEIIYRERLYRN